MMGLKGTSCKIFFLKFWPYALISIASRVLATKIKGREFIDFRNWLIVFVQFLYIIVKEINKEHSCPDLVFVHEMLSTEIKFYLLGECMIREIIPIDPLAIKSLIALRATDPFTLNRSDKIDGVISLYLDLTGLDDSGAAFSFFVSMSFTRSEDCFRVRAKMMKCCGAFQLKVYVSKLWYLNE
ncbi:hypothetical protein FRX31_017806 [Thalictrum thalictroides]|uniref:Uncharacterized protein n=1 Tax=Thalictrum thalictroides TaxID=46969 RepID=A0A7J6W6Q1_THATH|nr:hypothetical protein FRX31_017806 [Thalictrum thalictroides]